MQNAYIYPLPRGASFNDWRDRLPAVHGLRHAGRERPEIVFYDSFDWRLYAAGKRLECWRWPDRAELRLVRLADQAVESILPADSEGKRFACDLPQGPLRQCLQDLLEMRAYLPLATLTVHRHLYLQIDVEGKTRARLYLESFSLADDDGKLRFLQKRLRLQPLRGYVKAARGIGRILEEQYHLQAVEDDLYAQTLSAAGRHPGDYSSTKTIELQAGMRADAAVRRILLQLFATMQANEAGAIADLDSEFLHDFRVAVRRTRSVLGQLKKVFPPAALARFRGEFAWLGTLTGGVRDLDVYLLKFDSYQAALPAELRHDLEPLRSFLKYKQQFEHSRYLVVELRGKRYRKLKKQWERFLCAPLAKRPVARDAAKTIDEVASRKTWHIYQRVLREGQAITPESPPQQLHELRKSCKKLRYLMEYFQSLYPPGRMHTAVKELKQLQDNLGDFQDMDVQIESIRNFVIEMRRRDEYTAATGKAIDALLETLVTQMHRVRAEFESRFTRFSAENNQAGFTRLFHPDAPAEAA